MKLAICQLAVGENKSKNIDRAYEMLKSAKGQGAEFAILPEMFCITYEMERFLGASEPIPGGEGYEMLKYASKSLSMNIIGGSVPERAGDRLYNSCMIFSDRGELIGKYRKAHPFDIDYMNVHVHESDTITPGDTLPFVFGDYFKVGVSICYDVRFPEWFAFMSKAGVDLIALPAAFSTKTGPKHWELLLRARALDNQCFVTGVAPAASKNSYGHSILCSPDGEVLCELGEGENMQVIDLPINELERLRESIPVRRSERRDLLGG